jgi:hypothetical protein
VYEISTGVRSTRNEDGGIVLDIDQGQMFRLNPVGALILELLANGYGEADIANQIAHEYRIRDEMALTDVHEFLKSLETNGLVHTH